MSLLNNPRCRLGISLIVLFSTIIILSTCKEHETCLDCANGTIQSSFDERYFRIGVNSKFEFQLYSFDPSKSDGVGLGYGFCEFAGQSTIDSIDVIKASGNIKWACNKVDSFLLLKKFKTIDVCQITPPVIVGNFSLSGRYWYCESLFLNNKTIFPPCGFNPGIEFKNGMYNLREVVNGTVAAYSLIGSDSIKLSPGPITLYLAKTQYQRLFENNLDVVLGRVYPYNNPVNVWYQINDNRLVIKSKKGTIQLFSKN